MKDGFRSYQITFKQYATIMSIATYRGKIADIMANNTDIIHCFGCTQSRQINKPDEIKVGSHLEFLRCVMPTCQTPLYSHHAIVTEVMQCDSNKVSVKLVEYDNCGTRALRSMFTCGHKAFLCCNEKTLDITKNHVRIIQYRSSKYQGNAVADRAKDMFEIRKENRPNIVNKGDSGLSSDMMEPLSDDTHRKRYHLFDNNCEHFATWCVMDDDVSIQTLDCCEFFRGFCTMSLSWIIKIVINILLMTSLFDGITRYWSSNAFYSIVFIPSFIYLVLSLCKIYQQRSYHKRGKLCLSCYNEQFYVLVVRIVLYITFCGIDFSTVFFLKVFSELEVCISVAISMLGVLALVFTPELVFLVKVSNYNRTRSRYEQLNETIA